MTRGTVKCSSILIAAGETVQVFRSLEEVPPPLRARLLESTQGCDSATLVIADRGGREQLARAMKGLPTQAPPGVAQLLHQREASRAAAAEAKGPWRYWVEVLLVASLALLAWDLFSR